MVYKVNFAYCLSNCPSGQTNRWIGLTCPSPGDCDNEANWEWYDGVAYEYTNWDQNGIDNPLEMCGIMDEDGKWNSKPCDAEPFKSICSRGVCDATDTSCNILSDYTKSQMLSFKHSECLE